ncbi:MAG: HK97-gp10 family putative phage morphogenesis protein [Xanthobacteraceae bacterium]
MATTKILGLAKLERKLKRLPEAVKEEIKTAMAKQADNIVRLAKSLVPVDSHDLQDSIGWTWGKVPKGSITIGKFVGSKLGADLTLTIFAGNEAAYYARWVEFGTAATGFVASRENRKYKSVVVMTRELQPHAATPAQPFFYPAYKANRKSAKAAIRRAINSAAKKVAAS